MPNKKRSSTQRASPKLFRCTGYGNCDMVFTRSEHLARHERKHTGEKPYACVVSGCDRTFSRFDNMMQHTQTHEKPKKSAPPSINKRPSIVHGHRGMRATNLASIKTEAWYDDMRSPPELSMVPSMIDSRTLPLPRRASHSGYDHPYSSSNYRPAYPYPQDHCYNIPRNRSSWPPKKELFQPYPSHMQFNDYSYDAQRRSSTSTYSSDSNLTSPIAPNFPLSEPLVVSRRISIDNLRLPIENLSKIQLEEDYHRSYYNDKAKHIDITSDEYEALEGFSKFHSKAREDSSSPSEFTPSPIMRNHSPNMAAQVCAMRQRVMTQKESFQRR